MPDRDYITVSELNYYVGQIIGSDDLLYNVPVIGEVSGCSVVSGNCYFTLKDEKAQIKVVSFQINDKDVPSNGDKVLVRGLVNYYEPLGQISIKAYEISQYGVGLLHEKYIKLKEKLEKEGLFSDSHKKDIPQFPLHVGIITSTKGAAMQDIMSTIFAKGNLQPNVSFIDVRVQGDACVSDILTALNYADSYGFDIIMLARGGGSFEDLSPFNDERLVRAIYAMKTPIITAIGHETDYTLCDFVSDYRAITPTAGATKICFDSINEIKRITKLISSIDNIINKKYIDEKRRVFNAVNELSQSAAQLVKSKSEKIRYLLKIIKIKTNQRFYLDENKVKQKINLLDNLNPTKLLMKGYFRVFQDGVSLKAFTETREGDKIQIIGSTERITAIVEKKEKL